MHHSEHPVIHPIEVQMTSTASTAKANCLWKFAYVILPIKINLRSRDGLNPNHVLAMAAMQAHSLVAFFVT